MGPASTTHYKAKYLYKISTNTVTGSLALLQQLDDLSGVSPGLQPLQYPLVQEVPLPLGPSQGDPVDQSEASTVDC